MTNLNHRALSRRMLLRYIVPRGAGLRGVLGGLLLILLLALTACQEVGNTQVDPLQFMNTSLEAGYLNEAYRADLFVRGGRTPYSFFLEPTVEMPPGLRLSGGRIEGVPTEVGTFTFTVSVSDSALSRSFQQFSLTIAEAPTAELELLVPPTEIRERQRVRVRLKNARDLQALRTALTWDGQYFEFVEGSLRSERGDLAVLHQADLGVLRADMAFLGSSFSGNTGLFSFELSVRDQPNTVEVSARTEYLDVANKHSFDRTSAGQAPRLIDTVPDILTEDNVDNEETIEGEQLNPRQPLENDPTPSQDTLQDQPDPRINVGG